MSDEKKPPFNVISILKEWLEAHGYDGLYGEECGCQLSDLCPCDELCGQHCKPGYKHVEPEGSEFDFTIRPEKQGEKDAQEPEE